MYLQLNSPAVDAARRVPVHHGDVPPAGPRLGLTEPALYDSDERSLRTLVGDEQFARLQRARLGAARRARARSSRSPTASRRRPGKLEFVSPARGGRRPRPAPRLYAAGRGGRGARAGRPRLALVPQLDVRQQARPAWPRRAARGSRCIPEDAEQRGLETGDRARDVQRPRRVHGDGRGVRPRAPRRVASTKGHWLKHVRGGANINATVDERDADMGGGAVFHDNRVEVEAVNARRPARGAGRRDASFGLDDAGDRPHAGPAGACEMSGPVTPWPQKWSPMLVTPPGPMLPIERYLTPLGSLSIAICAHACRTVSAGRSVMPRNVCGNRY